MANKTIKLTTYMEPRQMRKATTGLEDGGFYIVKKSPSYSKKINYLLGFKRQANALQYRLKKNQGTATSEHVISKRCYDAIMEQAKLCWRLHKDVVVLDEEMTIKEEY